MESFLTDLGGAVRLLPTIPVYSARRQRNFSCAPLSLPFLEDSPLVVFHKLE